MAHELEEDFPKGSSARLVLKGVRPCQGVCRGPFLENSPATKIASISKTLRKLISIDDKNIIRYVFSPINPT